MPSGSSLEVVEKVFFFQHLKKGNGYILGLSAPEVQNERFSTLPPKSAKWNLFALLAHFGLLSACGSSECLQLHHSYHHRLFVQLHKFLRRRMNILCRCMIVRPCTAAIQSLSFSLYILKPFFPE